MTPPHSTALPADVAAALALIAAELDVTPPPVVAADDAILLAAAAAGDSARLKRLLKRRLAGEPLAYVLGELTFRGRPFYADKRAYITDPETSLLVDALLVRIDAFTARNGCAPLVAEFGCGGGALAISVQLERPAVTLVALELDPDALAVAAQNARRHGVAITFIESDLFDSWPLATAPDFIFGDPPWGGEDTLYDAARDAAHYRAMPAASAFPLGGRTGVHAQILRAVRARGWSSHVLLNGGVLPPAELAALAGRAGAIWHEIEMPRPGIALVHFQLR